MRSFLQIKYVLILLLTCLSIIGHSQRNVKDSAIGTVWLSIQYGLSLTSGDLADRHGYFNSIGVYGGYKTKKNWVFGGEGNFLFGGDVRVPNLFDGLTDSYGNITDQNGDIAIVVVYSRGMYIDASVGKIIPVWSPNENSGLYFNFGAGYLAHKIRVETQDHVVPELELDYRKGYDRLTTGFNAQQFIGYSYMANRGFVNFYGGFYVMEGFTFNRRTIFFDRPEEPVSTDMMLDLIYGVKLGWLIPIYKRKPKEYYFN